jgi:hypothetical protein
VTVHRRHVCGVHRHALPAANREPSTVDYLHPEVWRPILLSWVHDEEVSMSLRFAASVSGWILLLAAAGTLAAPTQDRVDRPGEPTKARVWIENRDPSEALPVVVHGVASPAPVNVQVVAPMPLNVQLTGTPTVALAPATAVQARLLRQPWEYRTVNVKSAQDMAGALAGAGAEGWEATAVQLSNQAGIVVLMKRPK